MKTRTGNSIRNFGIGGITQVVNLLLAFVVRTIFIKMLGEYYLGIDGLFTNILSVLSLAELGIGGAITYNMYKPIAEDDVSKVKALVSLYKKIYISIGLIIFIVGLCIIPFMKYLINDNSNISFHLIIIYILYLFNTSCSYFFSYKRSILTGYQDEYISNLFKMVFYIVRTVSQCIILLLTKNFILYLVIQIICTVLENFLISIYIDKKYDSIKNAKYKQISKEEQKSIFKDMRAMAIYKVCTVVLGGTDNIIISALFGITLVGYYSNYNMIVAAVVAVLTVALNGITGSLGNFNVLESNKRKEEVFYQLFYSSWLIYAFCTIALYFLLDDFITLWLGSNFLLSHTTVIAIVLYFYINGVHFACHTFRMTTGVFKKVRLYPIVSAIINIVLSLLLGYYMGIAGVFFATSIARLTTFFWVDPYLLYKHEFKSNMFKYYLKYLRCGLITLITIIICYYATKFITEVTILNFIIKGIIVSILSITCLLLFNIKNNSLKNTLKSIKKLFKREV